MTREDHTHARHAQVVEETRHHIDSDGVEAGERLVENREDRPVDQRHSELDPLLVSMRELFQSRRSAIGEAEALEPSVGFSGGVGGSQTRQPREVDELLVDAHLRIEAAFFGHVPENEAVAVSDRFAPPEDPPIIG